MLVIGLVGEKGSGKQTFCDFLKEILPEKKIRQVRFSDILSQTLLLWDIPISRSNLQLLSEVMNKSFGAGTVARAINFQIANDTSNIIILDGIRWKEDAKLLDQFPKKLLIYITAKDQLRYERLKSKGERIGEDQMSFAQFKEEEKARAEREIPQIAKKSDIKIENNETLNEFKTKVKEVLSMIN